ncbi:SDR family NAD(P)-dependent oxidoreductase [Weissella viridescens]|uniref:SDR family NAD(P)-dependent oxidoreductase n=1 Tax=Weissella viridescens TaxID=1629 RepID=A0A3P2RDS5_WEIVI|nr:NAD(P)H-binding protein [Weissella viridescens]RRG18767.1 SDR family NAD(P)-dependent oxidoreductase [Weissella viridescens]
MKIAVTGATGRFGSQAVQLLQSELSEQDQVIALARNIDKAKTMFDDAIEVRPGAYDSVETLAESMHGVDKLLFISSQPNPDFPRMTQHQNIIEAAKKADVQFIVYTSFPHADKVDNPLSGDHKQTEALIQASGIAHAFARNNWYLENDLPFMNKIVSDGVAVYSAGSGKVGWALEVEYVRAAVKLLQMENPKEIYEFSGRAHTYEELAETVARVSTKPLKIEQVSDSEYKQSLLDSGFDAGTADLFVVFQQLIRNGDLADVQNDLYTVLDDDVPNFEESVKTVLDID